MPIVGEYDLVQKLGHGSYADVFKGIHLPTSQRFAVKAISKERIGDRRLQENLTTEIAIMRDMRHLNIVGLYNTFENSKYIFLVLELCRGGDLSTFIKRSAGRRLDESIAQSFLRQLADGLYFLSERNIIHRDLKPANVLLSEPSEFAVLKLADFGFAKHLAEASLAHTQCGSPLYMAPEILENHEYDSKADLWSVGCIFFEMLAGATPFHGTNQRNLLSNILSKPLDIPADVSVGPVSVQLLRDLLKTNPGERIAMTEFHQKCTQNLRALRRPATPSTAIPSPSPDKPAEAFTPLATTPTNTSIESNFSAGNAFTSQSQSQGKGYSQSSGKALAGPSTSPGANAGLGAPGPPLSSVGGSTPPQDIRKSFNSTTTTTLMSLSRNMGTLARTSSQGSGAGTTAGASNQPGFGYGHGQSPPTQPPLGGAGLSSRSRSNSQEQYAAPQTGRSRSNSQDLYTTHASGQSARSRSNSYDYVAQSPSPKTPSYMAQYHPAHWAQSQPGPQPSLESQLIITDVDQIMTPSRQRDDKVGQQRRHSGSSGSTHSGGSDAKLFSTSPATPSNRLALVSSYSGQLSHFAPASPVPTMGTWMDSVCGTGSFTPLSASKHKASTATITPSRAITELEPKSTIDAAISLRRSKEATMGKSESKQGSLSNDPPSSEPTNEIGSSSSDDDFVLVETGVHPWHGLHAVDASDRPAALTGTSSKQPSSKAQNNLLSPIREVRSPVDSSLCSVDGSSGVSYRDAAIESSSCLLNDTDTQESKAIDDLAALKKNLSQPFGSVDPKVDDHKVSTGSSSSNIGVSDSSLNMLSIEGSNDLSADQALFSAVQRYHSTRETTYMLTVLGDEYVTAALSTGLISVPGSIVNVAFEPSADAVAAPLPDSTMLRSHSSHADRPRHMDVSTDSSSSSDADTPAGRSTTSRRPAVTEPIPIPPVASLQAAVPIHSASTKSTQSQSQQQQRKAKSHNIGVAAALYTFALRKVQVVLQSMISLAPSTDPFRSQLLANMKQELMKLFDGLLDRLDGCHATLSQLPLEHSRPLSTNAALYEVACQLNTYIVTQEKAGQLEMACDRYPYLLMLLEEVLQNCTSASASATEIEDELRLNKFFNAVEAQFKDCQDRLQATIGKSIKS